jgi:hypothetical protein
MILGSIYSIEIQDFSELRGMNAATPPPNRRTKGGQSGRKLLNIHAHRRPLDNWRMIMSLGTQFLFYYNTPQFSDQCINQIK